MNMPHEEQSRELHVVVVGGGVAGLTTAWRLLADPELNLAGPAVAAEPKLTPEGLRETRSRLRVTVVEARERLGGNIHSQKDQQYLLEWGPNGFLDNAPETPRLCRFLGIEDRLLPARDAAARRFLYVRGRLRPLPLSPSAFLFGDVLTLRGRMRVLREPFVPSRPDPEESVYSFAARRIGAEAAGTLVDAMVSGVYGGDARNLSLLAAFPKLFNLEKEHGGLIRGMLATGKQRRRERNRARRNGTPMNGKRAAGSGPAGPGGVLTSFDEGLEVLITSLRRRLEMTGRCSIIAGSPVAELAPSAALQSQVKSAPVPGVAAWNGRLQNGRTFSADAVVLAIPSRDAGPICRPFDDSLSKVLQSIPDAPLVVVGLAYPATAFKPRLEGFGFLVPRGEGPRILGALWDSCIYPGRAPKEQVLMRAMIGGAHDPEAHRLDDEEIIRTVQADLISTMGLAVLPSKRWIFRHQHGIPQYTLGHPRRLKEIEVRTGRWPGLHVTGNSYHGISVNACVEHSIPVAREILKRYSAGREG